jgi:hypothetical protein
MKSASELFDCFYDDFIEFLSISPQDLGYMAICLNLYEDQASWQTERRYSKYNRPAFPPEDYFAACRPLLSKIKNQDLHHVIYALKFRDASQLAQIKNMFLHYLCFCLISGNFVSILLYMREMDMAKGAPSKFILDAFGNQKRDTAFTARNVGISQKYEVTYFTDYEYAAMMRDFLDFMEVILYGTFEMNSKDVQKQFRGRSYERGIENFITRENALLNYYYCFYALNSLDPYPQNTHYEYLFGELVSHQSLINHVNAVLNPAAVVVETPKNIYNHCQPYEWLPGYVYPTSDLLGSDTSFPVPVADPVFIKDVIKTDVFRQYDGVIPIVLGYKTTARDKQIADAKFLSSRLIMADLDSIDNLFLFGPENLIYNSIYNLIAGIVYKKHPAYLKISVINFSEYDYSNLNRLDHLFSCTFDELVLCDYDTNIQTIEELANEVADREKILAASSFTNLDEYNDFIIENCPSPDTANRYLTRWVLFIDNINEAYDDDIVRVLMGIASRGKRVGIYMIVGANNLQSKNVETLFEYGLCVNLFNNENNINNIITENPNPFLEFVSKQGGFDPIYQNEYNTTFMQP